MFTVEWSVVAGLRQLSSKRLLKDEDVVKGIAGPRRSTVLDEDDRCAGTIVKLAAFHDHPMNFKLLSIEPDSGYVR
jgi:hypothetical protein